MRGKLGLFAAAAVALVLSGCSSQASAGDFSQAEIDGIIKKCGAPRDTVKFNEGWVVVRDASESQVADFCVLTKLKGTGKKHLSIVANEIHSEIKGR